MIFHFSIHEGDIVRYRSQRDNLPLWLGRCTGRIGRYSQPHCVAVDWFQGSDRTNKNNEGVITNVCRLRLYDGRAV